jgi:hypothetical protein
MPTTTRKKKHPMALKTHHAMKRLFPKRVIEHVKGALKKDGAK